MVGGAQDKAEQARAGNAENSVGASGNAEDIVDQSDAHNFADADGDDTQIVTSEMDDGTSNDQGKKTGGEPAERNEPQHRNLELGVEDRRGVGSHGIKGGMPEIEKPRMADNQIETERQNGIDTDVIENVNPVGIEK